ncbi:MAG: ATP-binding protein, partial [Lachnospiraceae bacterium]|nr:ATP-binding protein [Lachnospiraceae bacterium]
NTIRVYISLQDIQGQLDEKAALDTAINQAKQLDSIMETFRIATDAGGCTVFLFDYEKQSILISDSKADEWGVMVEQTGVPYEVAKSGIVDSYFVEEYIQLHEAVMNGSEVAKGRVGLQNAKGEHGIYDLTLKAILDEDGNNTGRAVGVYVDVTQSVAVVEALSRDYVNVFTIYPETRRIREQKISASASEALGVSRWEYRSYDYFVEKLVDTRISPEEQEEVLKNLNLDRICKILEEKPEYSCVMRINVNGGFEHFQMKFAKIVETGEIIAGVKNVEDIISEEAEQRKVVENALEQAEKANKAKTSFLNSMSHDIRTPMNAIIGFTALAMNHIGDGEKVKDYLEKIQMSSNHLLSLINDVLDMSRIESGNVKIEETENSISNLVNDLKNIVQVDVNKKQLIFLIDSLGIKDDLIWCDRLRLNQILLNCLSNAIKFTPTYGTVKLTVKQIPCEKNGVAAYEFKVSDTGIGMSPEFAEHIFEPFTRESTSTVSGIQGTGLGMSITKTLVDIMGGTIKVKSEKNRGSEFTIYLEFSLAERDARKAQLAKAFGGSEGRRGIDGLRILIVEDNELNREIASELLMEKGAIIDTAVDGTVAVSKIEASDPDKYDLVLMDVQMPIMNGYEATKAIRRLVNPIKKNIPIIAMTANAFEEDKKGVMDSGMDGHIAKPFNIDVVIDMICEVLEKNGRTK